jgi:hypothetical protein
MDETIARISKYRPELGKDLLQQYEESLEEKRPYTLDDYRDDFGGLLAEEAEENARLNSWQHVEIPDEEHF